MASMKENPLLIEKNTNTKKYLWTLWKYSDN